MKIFFTPRAEKDYDAIKEYLENSWGESVAIAFEDKTVQFLDLLESFPEIGPVDHSNKQIRGFQLTN